MSREFESLIFDPDLLDEGVDVSGLRTETETNPLLLGDVQPGVKFDPTLRSTYSDLLKFFGSGLPMLPEEGKVVPPGTGGGDSGSGGQGTVPTDDFNKQEFEQNLIDQGVGLQIGPGQPVFAPGEAPVTNLDIALFNDPTLGFQDEFTGLTNGTGTGQVQAEEFANIVSPTGIGPTYDEAGLNLRIPDRGRGQIPTSTDEFDITTDTFDMPRGGGADFAGVTADADKSQAISVDGLDILDVPSTEILGTGVQPVFDETFIDSTGRERTVASPFTLGNVYTGDFDPDDEGTVFDTSEVITQEDTPETFKDKLKKSLGIDKIDIPGTLIRTAINTAAGKAVKGFAPITLVFDFAKELKQKQDEKRAEEEAAAELDRQRNLEEARQIQARIDEEDRIRRETEAADAAAERRREEAAIAAEEDRQRREREAADAARQRAAIAAAEAAERAQRDRDDNRGGGRDQDPSPPTNVGNPFGYR